MEDLLSVFSFFCTNIFSSVKVSFCLWPYKLTSQGKLKQISESALLRNIYFFSFPAAVGPLDLALGHCLFA